MKNFMSQKGLIMKNASDTITKLEEYLWFSSEGRLTFPNWAFSDLNDQDAGLLLNLLIGTGKGKGGCTTEYAIVDMRAKAIGIPTMAIFRNVYDNNGKFVMGYMHAIYYDSQTNTWEGYHNQLEKGDGNRSMDEIIRLFIMEAPIFYSEYFQEEHDSIDTIKSSPHYIIPAITRGQVAKMFEGGVSDLKMKQWLLYS